MAHAKVDELRARRDKAWALLRAPLQGMAPHLDKSDAQRRGVMAYVGGLSEADLKRESRIPIFKDIMGTEEVDIPTFVGALFECHWNDHAGQLAKIRKAAGLPEAK